jgi:hypothetical protein
VVEKNKQNVGLMNKNRGTLVLRLGAWKLTGLEGQLLWFKTMGNWERNVQENGDSSKKK